MQRSLLCPLVYSAPVAGHGAIRLRGATYGGGATAAPAAPAAIATADASTVGHGTIRMGTFVKGVSFAPVRVPDATPKAREGVAGTSKSRDPRLDVR